MTPEHEARREIDKQLTAAGWIVQEYKKFNPGVETRFKNNRDPKPRFRVVFSFHQHETLQEWLKQSATLRRKLTQFPRLNIEGLSDCQIRAIRNLEQSFAKNKPRAFIQMATGSGKTFTAITYVYRLLKFADAARILFLVDTRNLG